LTARTEKETLRGVSFDLGFWREVRSPDPTEASATYLRLLRRDTAGLEPSDAIQDFLSEVTKRFPEIDDIEDEDELEECPWTCAFDKSTCHVIVTMRWGCEEDVAPWLIETANRHGLVCFDPQAGETHAPEAG
jgi:hypothetical protein